LEVIRAAAAELPRVDVADALAIVLLMSAQDDERYSPEQQDALERIGGALGEALNRELEALQRTFKEPVPEEKAIDTRPIKVATFEC
jgi:hypothetical protein